MATTRAVDRAPLRCGQGLTDSEGDQQVPGHAHAGEHKRQPQPAPQCQGGACAMPVLLTLVC